MADDNTKDIEPNKIGKELVRDENGKVVSGVLNPFGRPKKGTALTDLMREMLEEPASEGSEKTRKEVFVKKVLDMAYGGNETMIKLAWSYIEGMPTQRLEIDKPNLLLDEPTEIQPTSQLPAEAGRGPETVTKS
jgi:hypothetical protein